MDYAIETNNLTKSFGPVRAVEAVDLRVKPGEIYGFLGLNGSGKTTTIRMLLGMIRPDAGSAQVLGCKLGGHPPDLWRRVGHLVERPSAYPELSVRENLEIARRLQGIAEQGETSRVIALMGLGSYQHRRAGTLSTGNLQRLGLARALLHRPDLLILDEPANGLDPAGVVEIRELLADLSQHQGVTVFMSSHVLSEVDRLATRIGIIHQGRLIEELDAGQLETLRSPRLEIRARSLEAAREALVRAGYGVEVRDRVLVTTDPGAVRSPEAVATLLVEAGAPPSHLALAHDALEDHFLRLTGEST